MSDEIVVQLRRIRGQIDGVISMYEQERNCIDIVRQVIAVRNSLGRVARRLFSGEAARCSRERKNVELDALLQEMFKY
jgi:DNA-binding FrmR family transcriptional regulator